jgi:uncharacterized membrane protein required for colicin V production
VWPNWIDLIVVTTFWIGCYNGFGRGFIAELFNLIAAVAVTIFTVNFSGMVTAALSPWIPLSPPVTALVVFWGLFLTLWYAGRIIRKRIAEVIKWERFNWFIQGAGLVLGGLRGLWWAGLTLLVLSAAGYDFLTESVHKKSVLAPRLLHSFQVSLEQIADRLPGARLRTDTPVPPIRPLTHGSAAS